MAMARAARVTLVMGRRPLSAMNQESSAARNIPLRSTTIRMLLNVVSELFTSSSDLATNTSPMTSFPLPMGMLLTTDDFAWEPGVVAMVYVGVARAAAVCSAAVGCATMIGWT